LQDQIRKQRLTRFDKGGGQAKIRVETLLQLKIQQIRGEKQATVQGPPNLAMTLPPSHPTSFPLPFPLKGARRGEAGQGGAWQSGFNFVRMRHD